MSHRILAIITFFSFNPLFANLTCQDIFKIKPTWNFPLSISEKNPTVTVSEEEIQHPEPLYHQTLAKLPPEIRSQIMNAFRRVFAILPPEVVRLFPDQIEFTQSPNGMGAAVWVAKSRIHLPLAWMSKSVSEHEILSTIAHEIGHIAYGKFVAEYYKNSTGNDFPLNNNNEIYRMLAPIDEVFADALSVAATGRPDAIALISPENSLDREVRNFANPSDRNFIYLKTMLDSASKDLDLEEVHVKSRLRHTIWRELLRNELPHIPGPNPHSQLERLRKIFSKAAPTLDTMQNTFRRILHALTPIRWSDIIYSAPDVPGLMGLAAMLALIEENVEISLDTLESVLLKQLESYPDTFYGANITSSFTPLEVDIIIHSPALVEKMLTKTTSEQLLEDFKVHFALDESQEEALNSTLELLQTGYKPNIEVEIKNAQHIVCKKVTRSVNVGSISVILREPQRGYVDIVSEASVIDDFDDLEVDAESSMTQQKVTVKVRADGSTYYSNE